MEKILVVYYSRTGTTKKVAEDLAHKLNSDIEEIIDKDKRKGLVGYIRSGRDAVRKRKTDIELTKNNPDEYDLVIIGTPVWAFTMSAPIRTYLMENIGKFKKVAFFTTQKGKNEQKVFKDIKKIINISPKAKIFITTREVAQNQYEDKINNFIIKISDK
jgi:flavodoxin